jgi:anti-sigma B factor antagonist
MENNRPVVVKRMPQQLNARQARSFWKEVQPLITADRPQLVFDLSPLKYLDSAGVDTLLRCMSEVMKRDGDLKLAAVNPEVAVILEMTRTDRFFEIYETASDAVCSFSRFLPAALRQQPYSSPAPTTAAATATATDSEPGLAA